MNEKFDLEEERKLLVLERFKTLNPDAKISLGGGEEITVKKIIYHIEKGDDFGKKAIQVQIKMLQVLGSGVPS